MTIEDKAAAVVQRTCEQCPIYSKCEATLPDGKVLVDEEKIRRIYEQSKNNSTDSGVLSADAARLLKIHLIAETLLRGTP